MISTLLAFVLTFRVQARIRQDGTKALFYVRPLWCAVRRRKRWIGYLKNFGERNTGSIRAYF